MRGHHGDRSVPTRNLEDWENESFYERIRYGRPQNYLQCSPPDNLVPLANTRYSSAELRWPSVYIYGKVETLLYDISTKLSSYC